MSRLRLALAGALFAAPLAVSAPAAAHVTLEVQQAPPNSTYRATFRVAHGCQGAATNRVTIRLPEGVTQARPMPKPGWTLRTVPRTGAAQPTDHGAAVPVAEVIWEGGDLPDGYYDEFVIQIRLPNTPGEMLYIPVVQDCPGGAQAAWTDIPEPGRRITEYRNLAPVVRLLPRN